MADTHFGDIMMGGKPYKIDFNTWRGKDIIDFAPRATVPGGSFVMADLGLLQPIVQSDWRHGFGFHWYADAMGYLNTVGQIDTRQDGLAMLYTSSTSSDNNNNIKEGMTVFNGIPYTWGNAGLRKYSSGTWSEVDMRVALHTGSAAYKAKVAAASTLALSVTTHDLSNRLLVVFIGTKANVTVSALTYNGNALTQKSVSGTSPKMQMYYMVAPDPGANTLSLTLSGSTAIEMVAYVIYGVDQTTPLDTETKLSRVGQTSSSIDIASAVNDLVIDGIVIDNNINMTEGAGQINMGEDTVNSNLGIGTSKEVGAATTTMSWTWTGATDTEHIACNVNRISTQPIVNYALPTSDYLFVAVDGDRLKKLTTADVVSEAGLDYNAVDYKWIIIHNGYVYAGKDNSNAIHFDNSETLATLQGNSSDTNRILVGLGAGATLGAEVYNGNLYVRKRDGIWMVGEDRIARRVLDFSAEASDVNLRSVGIINGFYVFALRDRILQWNGARVSDITPKKITDTFPYTTYGQFDNYVAVGDYLYMTARTNETTYTESLLCWDGVGWHKLADLITNGTDSITMLAYESVNNRLWYHVNATADATYYIPFQNRSTFPYAAFPTSGQHSLISSRLDMGFRRVQKSTNSIIVEARNVTPTCYIRVYYSLDGGSWVLWGDVKTNGMIEMLNPGGVPTREFYYAQLRFDFITADTAQSPILEGWTMKFIMRPVTKMGYNFRVMVATNVEHGAVDDYRTADEILLELQALRNSISPIELVDIQGKKHTGYVTAIQEMPLDRDEDDGGEVPDIEYSYSINYVEI